MTGTDPLLLVVTDDDLALPNTGRTTRRLLEAVASAHTARVVVDMHDVQILNSCGIGVLIELNNEATRRGGSVSLRGLRSQARNTLTVLDLLGPAFLVEDEQPRG
ncbi:STAS domain-containing protein [Jatrophihabitans fulvus]